MSINALVLGTLLTQPTQRTAKSGNAYTVCRLKVAGAGTGDAGADTLLVNCIAFSETAQAALLALDAGEGIAVSGQLRAGVWQANDGTHKPGLDMTVGAVLSAYSIAKRRRAMQPDQGDRQQDRPSDAAWRAAAPAGRGPQDQRRPHPPQRAGLDDDLDDDLDDVF